MENRFVLNIFVFILLIGQFFSCSDKTDNPIIEELPQFAKFSFLKKDNPQLEGDITINNLNDSIVEMFIPHIQTESLIATFSSTSERVEVNGIIQESGLTSNDFNNTIIYNLIGKNGKERKIKFIIRGYNGIPRIIINTKDAEPITSREEYVNGNIIIENAPEHGLLGIDCKIRGRGNASWNHPKKSFKVKAADKISPFGFASNKDWVLLGNYTDKSLLRTAYVSEFSRAMDIKYTIDYQMVDLIMNGEYQGVYCFTDHVEKAKNRINIDKDGFFIEDDTYYKREPLYFKSDYFGFNFTFKYPKADDGDIVEGDENYTFIKDFINQMEESLKNIEKSEDYKNFIDIESFAKYFVVAETTGNLNPNRFYVLQNKKSRLEAYPFWDAEWSFALGRILNNRWCRYPHEPMPSNEPFFENYRYFTYLVKSSEFKKAVKAQWDNYKIHIPEVKEKLNTIQKTLNYAQKDNFKKWDVLGKYLDESLVAFNTWEEEVNYMNNWFDERIKWFDNYISEW